LEPNDEGNATNAAQEIKDCVEVVTNLGFHGHPQIWVPEDEEEIELPPGPIGPVDCALDVEPLASMKPGDSFKLTLAGIDLSGPLGNCLPGLFTEACRDLGKDTTVMKLTNDMLGMWLNKDDGFPNDWKIIERRTVHPIDRMRKMGLTDDQIADAMRSGPFRKYCATGHIEFHATRLHCRLDGPQMIECVQACFTELARSGCYLLAALILQQDWHKATSPRARAQIGDSLWRDPPSPLRETEELLRAQLGDCHAWGDPEEPHDLEFHRLKSLFCTRLCVTKPFDPVQAGAIVIADLCNRPGGQILPYQTMVMVTLCTFIETVDLARKVKSRLIGNLQGEHSALVEQWLKPLDRRIAILELED
jgi:hypothetical protein